MHSNEPSHHYGYLYDYSGEPWKTQAKVREIAKAEYANQPSGIDGDDDCGQMSSWYLFTAMGFYPVNPASGGVHDRQPALYEDDPSTLERKTIHSHGRKQFVEEYLYPVRGAQRKRT